MLQAITIVLRKQSSVKLVTGQWKVALLHHSRCVLIVHPLIVIFFFSIWRKQTGRLVSGLRTIFYYYLDWSIPWGIISGFLSMLSALASLNSTPFWSDGDNVELVVVVLLIRLARVLSRLLECFIRTTRNIADSISKKAPKIPNNVPRSGLSWRNAGAKTGEKSENGEPTVKQRRWDLCKNWYANPRHSSWLPVCFSELFTVYPLSITGPDLPLLFTAITITS